MNKIIISRDTPSNIVRLLMVGIVLILRLVIDTGPDLTGASSAQIRFNLVGLSGSLPD